MHAARLVITRAVIGAYGSFLAMTVICSLLYPQVFDKYEYGISTFGSVQKTLVVYYLGFAGTIACLSVIAWKLRDQ